MGLESARVSAVSEVMHLDRLEAESMQIIREVAAECRRPVMLYSIGKDSPLELAEARDPKGLYRKARRGEIKNFTGIDSPYEVPESPELRLETDRLTPEQAAEAVLEYLRSAGVV
jgi:adenylylsulfate kinase-like enzyme